jgi:zinc protease
MCFNGTKNFPGKALLDYLQSIGAEFGRNINASTGFEQTQYMLNNIPIVREGIIDSCLLVMHDYSHFVTNNHEEIDAERGVILEERRTRRDASWRMFEKSRKFYFGNTHMAERTLIGGEEQLKTFKYESLENFYKTWYQPDMQAIIVVGDIDVDQIESKIKTIFSDIPAPAVPTNKPVCAIPDNKEPIVGVITDPEATSTSVEIIWKSPSTPREFRNTDAAFINDMLKSYIGMIMNERFTDIASKPNAPFLNASFGFGSLCDATEGAFGSVSCKDGDAINAFTALMVEMKKAMQYGFTDGEYTRAKDKLISYAEKAVEAADTRKNPEFVRPIINHFFKNEAYLTPQMELDLIKAISAQLNAQVLSTILPQVLTEENVVILYNGPEKEGVKTPTEVELLAALAQAKDTEIEAPKEEVAMEPLVDAATLKGSAVKKETKTIYGATEWILKNGVKVVILPTEHKKDQVLFNMTMDGGLSLVSDEDIYSFEDNIWALYLNNTGVSKFPLTTLRKMLAGKIASMSPQVGKLTHGFNGSSSPKDIETALQLLYLQFVDPRFDAEEYAVGIQQIEAVLPNLLKDPNFIFQTEMQKTLYGNDPRIVLPTPENLAKANLETLEKNYRMLYKDAAGAVLTITGNVDLATLKPLVEKYVGSLPKGKKATKWNENNSPKIVTGKVENITKVEMQTPKATVLQVYSAYMPVDVKLQTALKVANFALDMIYVKTLREEEGGTYGASASMSASKLPVDRVVVQVYFDTNVESQAKLRELAVKGLQELAANGPTAEQFTSAIENLKKNLPEQRMNNNYWMNALTTYNRHGYDSDKLSEQAINEVTPEYVKEVVAKILEANNVIEVVLMPK